ncbi:hypothetical protein YC2023_038234 [Brassica napus]
MDQDQYQIRAVCFLSSSSVGVSVGGNVVCVGGVVDCVLFDRRRGVSLALLQDSASLSSSLIGEESQSLFRWLDGSLSWWLDGSPRRWKTSISLSTAQLDEAKGKAEWFGSRGHQCSTKGSRDIKVQIKMVRIKRHQGSTTIAIQSLQQEVIADDIHGTLVFPPDTDTPGFEEEQKSRPEVLPEFTTIIAA